MVLIIQVTRDYAMVSLKIDEACCFRSTRGAM
jgi:hypothetical protein